MSLLAETDQRDLKLPVSVVSKVDLHRLISELEQLDNDLTSAEVRQRAGSATTGQLVLSEQLRDYLTLNQLDLTDKKTRNYLLQQTRRLKDQVPVIHMTFASSTDQESLRLLADWLRTEIHPQAVIDIGIQPDLLGGVYLRTTNQIHDFSLRAQLMGKRDLLKKQLEQLSGRH